MLLVMHFSESIHIVENFKANEGILSELFKSWSFITWFAFKYDYYIEETDTILYGEFFKVIYFPKNFNFIKISLKIKFYI